MTTGIGIGGGMMIVGSGGGTTGTERRTKMSGGGEAAGAAAGSGGETIATGTASAAAAETGTGGWTAAGTCAGAAPSPPPSRVTASGGAAMQTARLSRRQTPRRHRQLKWRLTLTPTAPSMLETALAGETKLQQAWMQQGMVAAMERMAVAVAGWHSMLSSLQRRS